MGHNYHHVRAAVCGGRKKKIPSPKEDSVTDLGLTCWYKTFPGENSVTDLGLQRRSYDTYLQYWRALRALAAIVYG
jgi:hypothetical protein